MKGLDTNVLIRYLVRDDKKQAERASSYIREVTKDDGKCYINMIVLCGLVWVLESAYEYEKAAISDVLEKILITKQFEIEQSDLVRLAVSDYKSGKGDLSDYLIGRVNHFRGCDRTATFDRTLKGVSSFLSTPSPSRTQRRLVTL